MVFADLQKNTFTACACLVLMGLSVLCAADNVSKQSAELSQLVIIPAGTWQLGSTASYAMPNEAPVRQVELPAFRIERTPVTNRQFAAFVEATNYLTTAERPVDWEEMRKQVPPERRSLPMTCCSQARWFLRPRRSSGPC